jgi:transcriptional regulator with XRE-family HTH domain
MEENNIFLNERLKKGYTQIEVAAKTGISQPTISQIEKRDNFDNIPFYGIKRLCQFYGIDIKTL